MIPVAVAIVGLSSLVLCAVLTGAARRLALSLGVMDVPNDRSSHRMVTPRGGGVAIVVATSAAMIVCAYLGTVQLRMLIAMLGGGAAVAAVGFLDDRRGVPAGARLAVHVAASIWTVAWLGGFTSLAVGSHAALPGWLGQTLAVLAIVWTLNLFNFMDGIDGLAASEAVFVAGAGAILTASVAPESAASAAAAVFACACAGFLPWNWPPARIFMGDVGSGYLGYAIATFTLQAARGHPAMLWVWLILGGVFFVDATLTLLRRSLRGERVHHPHRSHAYQWLARRWQSHRRVTSIAIAVNLSWLLPCAIFAACHPRQAPWLALLGCAPLAVLAWMAGAGRRESATT